VLVHVAAPNTGPWSLLPRERPPFRRRSSDGGQQREAIIASLDMWPDRVRQHLAAGRRLIGGHAGRERATAWSRPEWLLQDPLLHHRVLESSSRMNEGSEAMTGCETVLTRPASSVRPRTTRSSSLPVARAVTRSGLRVRGCRGADRDRREGGRVGPHLARRRLVFPSPRPPRSGHRDPSLGSSPQDPVRRRRGGSTFTNHHTGAGLSDGADPLPLHTAASFAAWSAA
jgi:hypothetical protein